MKRSNGWMFVGIICIVALVAVNTAVLAQDWQEEFNLDARKLSDTGKSDFFENWHCFDKNNKLYSGVYDDDRD